MSWIEQQLKALSLRTEYLYRLVQTIQQQLTNVRQQGYAAQQASAGSSSSGPGVYIFAAPSSGGINGATGGAAPPDGVPGIVTGQTVYKLVNGNYIAVSTNATVYNPYASAVAASNVCTLAANGDGTFTVLAQSCS